MANETPASTPPARSSGRSKVLPFAVGGIAIAGLLITWLIASPGAMEAGPARVGRPAPDFELESTTGNRWRLSGHRGREVLLVFFRTHT